MEVSIDTLDGPSVEDRYKSHPAKLRKHPRQQTCAAGHEYGWRSKECPRCRTHKRCNGCGVVKPLTEFSLNKLAADGRQWRCSPCRAESEVERIYGISMAEFAALLTRQGDHCALCPKMEPGGKSNQWHVDHDHATGRVRGLLCCGCNIQLGLYEKFVANPLVEEYLRAP